MFTFISLEQIEETMRAHEKCPEQKLAQNLFANHIIDMVFGEKDPYTALFF